DEPRPEAVEAEDQIVCALGAGHRRTRNRTAAMWLKQRSRQGTGYTRTRSIMRLARADVRKSSAWILVPARASDGAFKSSIRCTRSQPMPLGLASTDLCLLLRSRSVQQILFHQVSELQTELLERDAADRGELGELVRVVEVRLVEP